MVKVLPLFPAAVLVYFVGPGLTLSLLVRILWKVINLFIAVELAGLTESDVGVKVSIAVRKALFIVFLLLLFLELSLVVLLVVDLNEAGQSLVRCHAALAFQDVDHDAVRSLLDSLPGEAGFFGQSSLIAEIRLIGEIVDAVEELTALSVLAVALVVVLRAHLGLVVRWQVLLRYQLVHVVSVGARVTVLAVLVHHDIAAHLSLFHLLDFLVELKPLLLILELLIL